MDVGSPALETGQNVNAKRIVTINTCMESLLIPKAPFIRGIIIQRYYASFKAYFMPSSLTLRPVKSVLHLKKIGNLLF